MKVGSFIANALVQSRCREIGSPERKKMAIQMKKAQKKNVPFIVLEKIMQIAENEIIMDVSPFFYEVFR
jgi:hypothetical protein